MLTATSDTHLRPAWVPWLNAGGDRNPLNDLDESESELDSDDEALDEALENLEKLPPPPDPIPDPGPL